MTSVFIFHDPNASRYYALIVYTYSDKKKGSFGCRDDVSSNVFAGVPLLGLFHCSACGMYMYNGPSSIAVYVVCMHDPRGFFCGGG